MAASTDPVRGGDLLPAHVEAVFLEFLGRIASPEDVAIWMNVGSLRALLDGVLASEEYAARRARRASEPQDEADGPFVNLWTPELAAFHRPPGTVSGDGVAIVGGQGHLFLYGGSNDNLAMYRGEVPMAADWLERWQALLSERIEQARAAARAICFLVVPDKLAVYNDLFPQELDGEERPLTRLLQVDVAPVLYPADALHAARADGETYMRTDSHLTPAGNRLLAEATLAALGVAPALLAGVSEAQTVHFSSGDLGQHFSPPIFELGEHLHEPSSAQLVFDNWPAIAAAGGHIGTLRVFRRDDAPDPRTVVVFGDSYGFGDAAYPGVSWFMAQTFREVHFVWVPFGWDPGYLDRVGADLVVCQTAERFIARVPRPRVDVLSLAREGAADGPALGLERIFADVTAA